MTNKENMQPVWSVNNIYFECSCVAVFKWHLTKKAKSFSQALMTSRDMASHNPKKGQITRVREVLLVQVPPHWPASCTQVTSCLTRSRKTKSRGFFSQNVQGINYNPPKKVGTVLKHYFYFVHRGGLLYGKAVGVELRTTCAWLFWHHVRENIV